MTDQDISQRLSRLERQNRIMAILLLLMLCAGVFVAAKPSAKVHDMIQTKEIRIVGDKGEIFAHLGRSKDHTFLFMHGNDGKSTIAMNIMRSIEKPIHVSVGTESEENFGVALLEHDSFIITSKKGMAEVSPARITVGNKEGQLKHFP